MIDDVRALLAENDRTFRIGNTYFRQFSTLPIAESGLSISLQNSSMHYCHARDFGGQGVEPLPALECRDFEIAFLLHDHEGVLRVREWPPSLIRILRAHQLVEDLDRADDVLGWVHYAVATSLYNALTENIRQIMTEFGGTQILHEQPK